MGKALGKTNGFTLLEIVMVMLVMAIISVVFIGRLLESNTELIAGMETLKTHLRYAQSRAMSTSTNWYVLFSTSTDPGDYALYKAGGVVQVFPGESGPTVSLETGMTVPDGDGAVVNFDYLGRPFTDAAGTSAQSGVREIVTSAVGNIAIKPETGYIP